MRKEDGTKAKERGAETHRRAERDTLSTQIERGRSKTKTEEKER